MKSSLIVSVLAVAFAGSPAGRCQDRNPVGPPSPSEQPRITLSKDAWDFGTLIWGEEASDSFVITNEGDATLVLESVTEECDCTHAYVDKTELAPGEAVGVLVHMDSRKRMGRVLTNVRFNTNDPNRPLVAFTVAGLVKPVVELDPPGVTLSTMDRNAGLAGEITITANAALPALELIDPHDDPIEVRLEPTEDRDRYKLLVRNRPPMEFGRRQFEVELSTGLDEPATVKIPVVMIVQPRVAAVPEAVYIPANQDTGAYRQVRVQYFGEAKDFRVLSAESSDERIRVEMRALRRRPAVERPDGLSGPRLEQFIALHIPPNVRMAYDAVLKVRTSDADFESITVPLTSDLDRFRALVGDRYPATPAEPTTRPATSQPSSQPSSRPSSQPASQPS